jgi:hypothetical protein
MRGRLYRLRWWFLAPLAALVVMGSIAFIAFILPSRLYPSWSGRQLDDYGLEGKQRVDARNDRSKLQNDARTTLLQGLGGVAVLVGGYVAYQQLKVGREQLEDARHRAQVTAEQANGQLAIAQQGQITERLNTAIDHLSSDNDHVRLGGIYALERIAENSDKDREAIAEILTAYVRYHARWTDRPRQPTSMEELPGLRAHKPDVQAAMTVLGRRALPPLPPGETEPERLFLAHVDLREAGLKKANLRRADLREAHLEKAHLEEADLRDAQLEGAHLERAYLCGTQLEGAHLHGLQDTRLPDAHLEGTDLHGASADTNTEWPEGFDSKAHGVVVKDDEPKG